MKQAGLCQTKVNRKYLCSEGRQIWLQFKLKSIIAWIILQVLLITPGFTFKLLRRKAGGCHVELKRMFPTQPWTSGSLDLDQNQYETLTYIWQLWTGNCNFIPDCRMMFNQQYTSANPVLKNKGYFIKCLSQPLWDALMLYTDNQYNPGNKFTSWCPSASPQLPNSSGRTANISQPLYGPALTLNIPFIFLV